MRGRRREGSGAVSEDLVRQVQRVLAGHCSAEHPVRAREIALRVGCRTDVSVRMAIRELIRRGHPIASSVHPPQGYFYVEDAREAWRYLATLNARQREIGIRAREFEAAFRLRMNVIPAQMELPGVGEFDQGRARRPGGRLEVRAAGAEG